MGEGGQDRPFGLAQDGRVAWACTSVWRLGDWGERWKGEVAGGERGEKGGCVCLRYLATAAYGFALKSMCQNLIDSQGSSS